MKLLILDLLQQSDQWNMEPTSSTSHYYILVYKGVPLRAI
jgi:hypothetical protein